jgi:hypothetical protein
MHGDGRGDGHEFDPGPDGPGRDVVVLYCRIDADDLWWLLGSSGITRSPGAACPGMVVVAYSLIGVGRPVRLKVVDLGFLFCKDGDLSDAGLS